jgi:prophage regulatory protein
METIGRDKSVKTVPDPIIRMPKVEELTGLKKSTIYKLIQTGDMPSAVQLSPRAVGWRQSEIIEWAASRTAVKK